MRKESPPNQQIPNNDKLRELILYLAHESVGDPGFGAVKLQKLLFYSDFSAYLRLGKSISGYPYVKLEQGPVLTKALPLLKEMERDGAIYIQTTTVYEHIQQRVIPKREPLLWQFSGAEIDLVSKVIRRFFGMTAKQMTRRSHDFLGWQIVAMGEEIPYALALVTTREPTERMTAKARELGAKARSLLAGAN